MSDSDKKALLDGTATIQTEIEILPQNEGEDSVILTEKNSIVSWDYEDFRYVKDQGFIGQFVARQVNGVVKNISDDFVITDREFVLRMGVNTLLPYERINLSYDAENDKYFIDGKSEQETTIGKNLCYKIILQNQQNIRFYFDNVNQQNLSISFTINESLKNNSLYLIVDGVSKGIVKYVSTDTNLKVSTNIVLSSTQLEEIQNANESYFLLYKNGAKFSTPTDAQIELGLFVTDYEKYTGGKPSPNPEFPSEIKNTLNTGTYQTYLGRDNYYFDVPYDLSSIGNLRNKIIIDKNTNSYEFTRVIGKFVITEDTPIYVVTSPTQENSKFYTIDASGFTAPENTSVQIMSNIFTARTANKLWNTDEKNYCSLNTYGSIHIRVDSSLATVTDVRNYLVQNNVYFIGVLTTPITETGTITKKEHNTNWYSFGNFLVNKVTDDEVNDKTTFEALDYTKKFNQKYVSRVTYPCTLVELASDVCNQCGCELGNTDFKHNDWEIDGEYFTEGQSCRDVMKEISKLAYSWVRIDWDNKVYLDFNTTPFKNLHDKVNTKIITASIDSGNSLIQSNSANPKSLYVAIRPNRTYIVSKISSARFVIGTTTDIPTAGTTCNNISAGQQNTSLEINTKSSDNFLIVYYYLNGTDTLTEEEILNSIEIREKTDKYNVITNHEYYNLKTQKEKFGAVNRVVIGYKDIEGERTKVEDAESIEANGVHEITIYNNPLVHSQELREKAIIGAEDLLGLEYMPLETLTLGHPWLKGYELVEAVDMEGKAHKTIPFDRTIQYFGHIKTKITSGASTRTNTQYAYNADLEKRLVRAEISVNKNEGKIESVVSDTEIIKTNVNGISTNLNNNFYSKDQVDAMQEENNENIETVTNTVQNIQTSTQSQINVIQETIANGVSKVSTTSGTFDENGLNIAKTGEEMSSTLDWDGLEVVRDKGKSTETEVLTVRSAGVESENMTVRKYLTQRPIRQEKTKAASDGVSVGLGFFYVGEE